jgi:hypothetical protein
MANSGPSTPEPIHWREISLLATLTLLVHLSCINGYGYFRDELYYLACASRLDWGYVDHPPLSVAVLKLFTSILGPDIWAVRTPAILAGIGSVFLYAMVTAELGGKRQAQVLAACFAGLSPVYAVVSHLYSMNGIDIMLWAAAALCWLRAKQDSRLWLALGLILGFAMLNKLSGFWLVAGIGVATLTSPRRTELKSWQPWIALLIAFAVFYPHFIWQQEHGWITQEFIRNATQIKMVPQPPWIILGVQIVVTNPVLAVLWITGTVIAIKSPAWRPYSLTFFLVLALLLISMRSRENYLAPSYIFVLPAGAMALSGFIGQKRVYKQTYLGLLIASSIFCLGLALPLLPPKVFERIVTGSNVDVPAAERGKKSPLQGHADMFGWPTMAKAAREVWQTLPKTQRSKTPVLGLNYGESAAIWHFNRHIPDLKVIGRHNQYWLWGPGDWNGETLIVVGEPTENIRAAFESAELATILNEPWAVPEESTAPITIFRRLKMPVDDFWASIRHIQ